MSLAKGDVVDRYVIDGPIGAGGMGEVYRARDTRLQRNVALKILRLDVSPGSRDSKERTGPTDGAARMLKEARAAAALDHPNVVAIFDVGQIEVPGPLRGTTYLAMELIKGRSLRAFVGDVGVPLRQRIRWLIDAARALGAAHEAGLVHRDVKPDNVMVRDDGVVKVLDFGIARRARNAPIDPTGWTEQLATATATQGIIVGTPIYMAPEQLRGDPLDGRADQFSWAVMAYEVLTGKPPWRIEDGPVALLSQILTAKPPPLDAFDEIPPHAKVTLMRALEKDRELRFASMGDVVAALEGDADPFAPTASKIATGRTVIASTPDAHASSSSAATERASIPDASAPPKPTALVETNRGITNTQPLTASPAPRRSRGVIAALASLVALGAIAGGLAWRAHRVGAPASALAAPAPGCASNRACVEAHGGEAWVCRASDKQCVAVASSDCTVKVEPNDLRNDRTQWIGELYPLTGPGADEGLLNERATDLAWQDFAHAVASLGERARPLALVACDDGADGARAARHLVDDVGVPAIIGFKNGGELLDLAGSLLHTSRTLAVATMTTSPLVTQLPRAPGEPALVWRTMYGLNDAADAIAALVTARLEPDLRGAGVRRTRVALVRANTQGALALSEHLFDVLRFNGKTALENTSDYRDIVVDSSSDAAYAAALARLVDFGPRIVAYIGGDDIVARVLSPFESAWPATAGARPRYVSVAGFGDAALTMVGRDRGLRHRFYGLTLPSTTPVNARFTMHYNETFGTDLSRADAPSTAYDAFYVVAYAALARGDARSTGEDLARAIPRLLPPGAPVDVGPSGIFQALTRLGAGESIDLNGTTGSLDFDVATGERPVDLSILCPEVDRDGLASGSIESGAMYSSRTKAIAGAITCP